MQDFLIEEIALLKKTLEIPKTICITAHRNPDGDAMGSTLALYHTLKKMQHRCFIVMPSEYPENFEWMPGSHDMVIYDIDPEEAKSTMDKADLIFCLDFNSLDRIDKLGNHIQFLETEKVMIDHHMDPEPIADIMISDPRASSTCEMIFTVLKEMGKLDLIDQDIAACLYTGILTDTGGFRHATTANVFEAVAELKRKGLDDYTINDRIFNSAKEKNLRLLGNALLNRLEVIPEHHAGIIYLTKEDYETFDIQRGDTEGIVNYILTLKGIKLAAFITEQPTIVKLSLRSKYDINVQQLAREHFKGGGHKNASGGYTFEPLENAIERLKRVIPNYTLNKN